MNILLTSVGRRAYMVKYFKEVVGESGQVHVSNSDDKTVAFHYADKSVVTPLIYNSEYIPFLLKYCKDMNRLKRRKKMSTMTSMLWRSRQQTFWRTATQMPIWIRFIIWAVRVGELVPKRIFVREQRNGL